MDFDVSDDERFRFEGRRDREESRCRDLSRLPVVILEIDLKLLDRVPLPPPPLLVSNDTLRSVGEDLAREEERFELGPCFEEDGGVEEGNG